MEQYIYGRYKNYWLLIVLIIFMTALTGICNQINVCELFIFFCFQLFCILFPGIAIMILLPIRNLREIEKVLLAYASGYILTMLIYALVMVADGRRFLRIVFATMAIIAVGIVAYAVKKSDDKGTQQNSGNKIWIWTVAAVFFISLIAFSLRWKIPYLGGSNTYYDDQLYWMGDIVALTKQVPPLNFRSMTNYRYHYFGALQQAAVSSATGIPAARMAICYSYIESSVLLGLASYVLVDRMVKNSKVKIITLFLMLFSTGFEEEMSITYISHIYLLPMSYNIAQSLGLVVILLLLIQLKEEKIDVNNLLVMLCFLLCCAGTKSATGAVIFCGFLVAYIFMFFRKKEKKVFIAAFVVLAVFVLIGIYLMPTVKAYSFQIRMPEIDHLGGRHRMILSFIYSSIDWIIGYIRYLILANPWTFIPAGNFIVYSVVRKSIKKEYALLFVIMAIGTICGYAVSFSGHSEMYFMLTVFPIAAILAGCWLESISPGTLSERKQMLLTAVAAVSVVSFCITTEYRSWFYVFCNIGIQNLNTPNTVEQGVSVSHLECQAYEWIRENTDENALLLSDRKLEEILDPTGIFSERYVYVCKDGEERENAKAGFDGDEQMIAKFYDSGIDYVVQTKRLSAMFNCPKNIGEIVFDNDEVSVYRFVLDSN